MENKKESTRRVMEGIVVGNKMDKAVRVQTEHKIAHPVYKKVVAKRKVFFAHTDKELNVGDKVMIKESRPYSKNIRWVVVTK